MRSSSRYVFAVLLVATSAAGTLAFAQTRPGRKPPVVKTPAKPDAQAAPVEDVRPKDSASADAGASEGPVPASEATDGGRLSPLNPQANEMPSSSAVDGGVPVDYDRLLADIAALRARVAAVSDNLYKSRVAVRLQTEGDHGRITRLAVSIDDGVVYVAPANFAASDPTPVYEHAVAPGRHAVTIDVDRKDDRDDAFRTSQRSRFTVEVPKEHRLEVDVRVIDDSAMGADFPSDRSGKYDLRFRVKAVAKPVAK